jgi:dihydroneopterin aldolase
MGDLPPDRVEIVGLEVRTIIGIFPWERKRLQRVRLDLSMEADVRPAGRSDRIEDALDYKTVSKRVQAFVKGSRFGLLEALAEAVAGLVLAEFARVRRVHLRVEKPGALRGADTVAVAVSRARRGGR